MMKIISGLLKNVLLFALLVFVENLVAVEDHCHEIV
jgi:hypothetical protein